MSQQGISEYDAKQLFAHYIDQSYGGFSIRQKSDLDCVVGSPSWVIKSDQLFGGRGKLGLVGVDLDHDQLQSRFADHMSKQTSISRHHISVSGKLSQFIVEPYVSYKSSEYYVCIQAFDTHDQISFSIAGGVDIEQQRDQVQTHRISVLDDGLQLPLEWFEQVDSILITSISDHIASLLRFYRARGLVYLEVNPFIIDQNQQIVNLDMVAKIDTCQQFNQQEHRSDINVIKPFGSQYYPQEDVINTIDEKTGASVKLSILNSQGKIWLILGGGGASIVTIDSLVNAGLGHEVANYGDLSGNPSYDDNKMYLRTIVDMMLCNSAPKQYLCIIGGIANFTNIYHLLRPMAELVQEYADQLKHNNIHIIVRRGGIDDARGLQLIQQTCDEHSVPCIVHDGDHYLTDFISHIEL